MRPWLRISSDRMEEPGIEAIIDNIRGNRSNMTQIMAIGVVCSQTN